MNTRQWSDSLCVCAFSQVLQSHNTNTDRSLLSSLLLNSLHNMNQFMTLSSGLLTYYHRTYKLYGSYFASSTVIATACTPNGLSINTMRLWPFSSNVTTSLMKNGKNLYIQSVQCSSNQTPILPNGSKQTLNSVGRCLLLIVMCALKSEEEAAFG